MAPNFLGLSTAGKPNVDWASATGDNPDHYDVNRSGPVQTNLKELPKDALPISTSGREQIPDNSGTVKTNMKEL